MSQESRRNLKSLLVGVTTVALVASLSLIIYANRQFISDVYVSSTFKPSADIIEIESNLGLTEGAKRTFYSTRPVVMEAEDFNKSCQRKEEASAILGCYSTDDRLYIYEISNEKLFGMEEVTAGHELLHAVWSRLGVTEKSRLSQLLEAEYKRVADDSLRERMDYYAKYQPGQHYNELHSIIGTEYLDLSAELEEHYARYFKSRHDIVAYHNRYSGYYNGLKTESDEIYIKLENLSKDISSGKKLYDSSNVNLNRDIENFNSRARSGSFVTLNSFYYERGLLEKRMEELESVRAEINRNVEAYNTLQGKYTEIVSELETLNRSVDSYETIDREADVWER